MANLNIIKNTQESNITNSNKIEKGLNYFSYITFGFVIIASIVLTFLLDLGIVTMVSCIAGILYVCFLSSRSILNFIIGLVSTTTYIFIAFQSKLFGEVIFYLFFDLPMILISFLIWKKKLNQDLTVKSKKLSLKIWLIIIALSAIVVLGYSFILKKIGGVNVYLDALSTVVSVIATLLMCFRYREQWFMWIVVYAVSVVMWATTFNLLMLIMSICCLVSSFFGYIIWSLDKNIEK